MSVETDALISLVQPDEDNSIDHIQETIYSMALAERTNPQIAADLLAIIKNPDDSNDTPVSALQRSGLLFGAQPYGQGTPYTALTRMYFRSQKTAPNSVVVPSRVTFDQSWQTSETKDTSYLLRQIVLSTINSDPANKVGAFMHGKLSVIPSTEIYVPKIIFGHSNDYTIQRTEIIITYRT